MHTSLKAGMLGLSAIALAACASEPQMKTASVPPALNAEFSRALQSNYAAHAAYETDELDYADASRYGHKAAAAAAGEDVAPDAAGSRQMRVFSEGDFRTGDAPAVVAATAELASARNRLMARHTAGFARSHPAELARAQAQWDCWYEEQEEGYQLMHIARCHNGFESAMATMDPPAPTPAAAPAPAPAVAGDVLATVNFRFDSAELDDRAQSALDDVAKDVARRGKPAIVVVGHTDTAGTKAYNRDLSIRRAEGVGHYLARSGVSVAAIRSSGVGQTGLLVATGDEVRNAENRRATIVVSSE